MEDLTLFTDDADQRSPFDAIRQIRVDGSEFWSARDLHTLLGYSTWQKFLTPLERAMRTAANQGHDVEGLFNRSVEKTTGRPREDYSLSRFAAYLVAMNGDPNMPEVASAQSYFAIRTREAEVAPQRTLSGPELMALALKEADATMRRQEAQIEELKPKATAWDEFVSATGDVSVNEAAKALSRKSGRIIGERRLRAKLEGWSWIYRDRAGKPRAYQSQMDLKRLTERARYHYHPVTGEKVMDTPQIRVTAKGLDAIRTRLISEETGNEVAS